MTPKQALTLVRAACHHRAVEIPGSRWIRRVRWPVYRTCMLNVRMPPCMGRDDCPDADESVGPIRLPRRGDA
jgi:hypothetical protein